MLLSKWAEVRFGLAETIEKFTDAELTFWPFAGGYSVAETILHIAHEEEIEAGYGLTRRLPEMPPAYDALQYPSTRLLLDLLTDVHSHTVEYMENISDEAFEAAVEPAWGGSALPSEMLMHLLEHEIHHRGELSLMLGMLGRKGLDA
jgi:uncharacterized damage-inducible protein DinB